MREEEMAARELSPSTEKATPQERAMGMVERVARGICEELGRDPDERSVFRLPGQPTWKIYKGLARTALGAMREPTEAMVESGAQTPGMKEVDGALVYASRHHFRLQWEARGEKPPLSQAFTAMIDAALAEPTP